MSLAGWLELIMAVLKFPSAMLAIARYFQKTPAEKHQEIILQVDKWMDQSQSSERPTWEQP